MYPAHFFGLFPPFPRDHSVFVAMSFDPRFQRRWEDVIAPAIQAVSINDAPLKPVRVDARVVGDSILTENLSGIGRARLIFADLTSIGTLDARPVRNGNVLYEVGLAHAVRLPEEVLLFRSDGETLLFDTAHVRVNTYAPDEDVPGAKRKVSEAILSALNEVDLRRNLAVQATADALDAPSLKVLVQCQTDGQVPHPPMKTMGQALSAVATGNAIQRLLSLGLLRVRYKSFAASEIESLGDADWGEMMPYERTPFGDAVFFEAGRRMVRTETQSPPDTTAPPGAA